jgi:hypothetical protein
MMCNKCGKLCGILLLIVGILFLLQDQGIWTFWNLSWYTVAFLLMGIGHMGMSGCPTCQAVSKRK